MTDEKKKKKPNSEKKSNSEPLRQDWADALLGATTVDLRVAQDNLRVRVETCRGVLKNNPLSSLVAQAVLQETGREGKVILKMDDLGIIQVIHEEDAQAPQKTPSTPPQVLPDTPPQVSAKAAPKNLSKLPMLGVLREQAEKLNIDWKPFGKSRTKLLQAIQKEEEKKEEEGAEETTAPPVAEPPKKMVKTAPALSPVTVVAPDPEEKVETTPLPDPGSAEADASLPFGPNTTLPNGIGDDIPETPESAPPVDPPKKGKPKVDLKALAQASEALDIDDLIKDLAPEGVEETPEK